MDQVCEGIQISWKRLGHGSLSRAGAKLPPMTYGTTWVLVEARTGRTIVDPEGGASERTSLEDAGIQPGAVLWVVRLDGGRGPSGGPQGGAGSDQKK